MTSIKLAAEPRDPKKVKPSALRRAGKVPGIYYDSKGDVHHLQFDGNMINHLMSTEIALLELEVSGETYSCIIREVQHHPLSGEVLHLDLFGVVRGQKIKAHVPFNVIGTAVGIKQGGSIDQIMREVEVECIPRNLPPHLDVDVSNLDVNESIKIGDLHYEGITMMSDPSSTVVHVIPPRKVVEVVEEVEEAAEEGAEPEVITEKKGEEEEAAS
jgi:large subunit ribosomal protein L25